MIYNKNQQAEIETSLEENGWAEVHSAFSDIELIDYVKKFGDIINHPNGNIIDELKPKDKSLAIKKSFSYQFEFKSFPLHTDTAFWHLPARYLILYSDVKSNAATTVINFNTIIYKANSNLDPLLRDGIFLEKTPSTAFYTKLLNRYLNRSFIRFDPNTMYPMNKEAKETCKMITDVINHVTPYRIEWNIPKLVIIDNWHCLHGREEVNTVTDTNRILKRIYLTQKNELEERRTIY
ncbi:TauD/TfdA family dioxygenase [Sphingobacterium faecium]|uniref:TauD/TfdA family dioxygenase n=1 Tax=Sphingobacterium faecium TaxID=34087 RepID=UPI0021B63837|nr:TauD/TfdA family dioxygenase [Sphingobacterium faecium]UXD71072.1 TauD/TfdA family dioxygenase [Sphingobacterium faecium]